MNLDHNRNAPSADLYEQLYKSIDNVIGCTFTLNPEFCRRRKYRNQLNASFNVLNNILCNHFNRFIIVAELTKQSNIHYHMIGQLKENEGYHYLNDNMRYNKIQKMFGMHKVENKIHNIRQWIDYMFKDMDQTYKIINKKGSENYNIIHIKDYITEPLPNNMKDIIKDLRIHCKYDYESKYLEFD